MRILAVVCFLCSVVAPSASALELQGAAVYQRLNNDVYIASIHSGNSDSRAWLNSRAPLTLEMHILAESLSPRRFSRLWNEGLAINLSQRQMNEQVDELTRFMYVLKDNLVEGDEVAISNETGETRVTVNGVELLMVEKPGMVQSLLKAWIGKYPRSQQFKERLINMSGSDRSAMKKRLMGAQWQPERVAVIESWKKPKKKKAAPVNTAKEPAPVSAPAVASTVSVAPSVVVSEAPEATLPETTTPETTTPEEPTPETIQQEGPSAEELEAQRLAAEAQVRAAAEEAERERQEQMRRVEQQLAESAYYRNVLSVANGNVKYPRSALKRQLQGVTRINMVLDREGNLTAAQISETSEHPALDKAALKAAQSAAPYPPLPKVLDGNELEFDVPFRFVMRVR
ncbi:MAG: TonB family protein [Oceanobacter sp.]